MDSEYKFRVAQIQGFSFMTQCTNQCCSFE